MKLHEARRWLAVYFLLLTAITGGYLLLFGESPLLPMSKDEAKAGFQILIPVLIGQIAVIFQWVSRLQEQEDLAELSPLPTWSVKLPAVIVAVLIIFGVAVLVIGNSGSGQPIGLSPEGFNGLLTFAVSILNASTIFLVARLFGTPKQATLQDAPSAQDAARR
jgi:hypothetical protein